MTDDNDQSVPDSGDARPILDASKLAALPPEQQELYLLTFSGEWRSYVLGLSEDDATTQQSNVQTQTFDILALTSPQLTRVVRRNLGAALGSCLGKCDRRTLYETVTRLIAILNNKESLLVLKHAAITCLGSVMAAAGDSAIPLVGSACTALLKIAKATPGAIGLRSAAYRALTDTVTKVSRSMDEATAKDIWKAARSAAQEKAYAVQINACHLLQALVKWSTYFDTRGDVEKLLGNLWKVIDSPSTIVRRAAAACLATILVKIFSDDLPLEPVQQSKKSKKPKKSKTLDDDDAGPDTAQDPSNAAPKGTPILRLSLLDTLRLLSTIYTKASTTVNARAAIVSCYDMFFARCGPSIIEKHYLAILTHLVHDFICQPALLSNRHRLSMARKHARLLLENTICNMLGETSQINTSRALISNVLKDYPQTLKERPEPNKYALVLALGALNAHISKVQAAFVSLADLCRDALIHVLQHTSFTVQVHAARSLRLLTTACPQQLLPAITVCMNSVARETGFLNGPRQSPRRCTAFANGVAALLRVSHDNPLYGSVDVYVRVYEQATSLLKASGTSSLRTSSTQVSVAWTIMSGLMSLGPSFIKVHLSQLMLLWRNALPVTPSVDELNKRNVLELSYMTHVRECALTSLLCFLTDNVRLVTADVVRRVASMLENTLTFLDALPVKGSVEDPGNRLAPALQLHDLQAMLRRRLYQCCVRLITCNASIAADITEYSAIMISALQCFVEPESRRTTSLTAAIVNSTSSSDSARDSADNWGFGINSLSDSAFSDLFNLDSAVSTTDTKCSLVDFDTQIDALVRQPCGEALEHDPSQNYKSMKTTMTALAKPSPTEAINAAIVAFALIFPTQSPRMQASVLNQLVGQVTSSTSNQVDTVRRSATTINIAQALLFTTMIMQGHGPSAPGRIQSTAAEKALQEALHTLIADADLEIRSMASECLGRLCGLCGTEFTNAEVAYLIDMIVKNPEPYVRAGSALALSHIHAQLGGMAANYHLNAIVGILMSLAADPYPMVHYWALDGLCRVIECAGPAFSVHVSSCIGLICQLYVRDTHNVDADLQESSNLQTEQDTVAVLGRCVTALINVLGPDLQDMSKPRNMILTLMMQLQIETTTAATIETIRCWEAMSLYAAAYVDFAHYLGLLKLTLSSPSSDLSHVALRALADIMRRDAERAVTSADDIESVLWNLFDTRPDDPVIAGIFQDWLQQDGLSDTTVWVKRCRTVLTESKKKAETTADTAPTTKAAGPDLQDEEVAGFAATAVQGEVNQSSTASVELVRWQVRLFAMDLLTELLHMIIKESSSKDESPAMRSMQLQVGDVIKIAFSASTSGVAKLRVRGLGVIDQILKMFGSSPDPDFTEVMLLEQYQAQISSALTPAFASDSLPELAAQAVSVCATFISTSIVTEVDRMGRILKLLVSALQTFSDANEPATIGELTGLSPNASTMVKMAVLSAWAKLQTSAVEQKHLESVVEPHIKSLLPLWLVSLQKYARLRFEPDTSDSLGTTQSSDITYAAMNRETLLQFYQESWLKFVEAIASLIETNSDLVFDALNNKSDAAHANGHDEDDRSQIDYRAEPAAFFFVLFGLAFEALTGRGGGSQMLEHPRRLEILQALHKILRPAISGTAIFQDHIFSETVDLFSRIVLTEAIDIQTIVVSIARNLCTSHPSSTRGRSRDRTEDHLSDDIEQLFELTRIIVLTLTGLVPGLAESNRPVQLVMSEEAMTLVILSLEALVDVADTFPSVIKGDLHACIFHLFASILASGPCQNAVVPQAMPVFKRFIGAVLQVDELPTAASKQIRNLLGRFMVILRHAQKRENTSSLACEKNTLLASTILVTGAQQVLQAQDMCVVKFIDELVESIDSVATSAMAAGCARSLLLVARCSQISAQILVRLLGLLSGPALEIEGLRHGRTILVQALASFACAQPSDRKTHVFALVAASMLTYVRTSGHVAPTRDDADDETVADADKATDVVAAHLLELAANDAAAFRSVVLHMSEEQRSLLQEVLHSAHARSGDDDESHTQHDTGEPSIALKLNF